MDSCRCPVCQVSLPSHEIEWHVNSHFEDDQVVRDMELAQQIALAPPSPPDTHMDSGLYSDLQFESLFEEIPESSTSWDHQRSSNDETKDIDKQISYIIKWQRRAPFYRVEGGLLNLLKNCLEREGSTCILSGYVDHYQSTRSEDMGWGCGWRNIQMISSHMISERPEAREALFGGSRFVPDIGSLQRWLEVAWQKGFDVPGKNYFNGKIYGSKKWIGTTECAGLLRSFGLRARIVDFDGEGGKRKAGPVCGPMDRFVIKKKMNSSEEGVDKVGDYNRRNSKGFQVLIDWVWNYFSRNEPKGSDRHCVVVTNKMPLYFQHQGHSRTIIGVQVRHQKNGTKDYNLLVLDPGHTTEALERTLKQNSGWQKFLKRGLHTLKKPQYQLCYVDPGIASREEMEQLKTLDSVLIEC